jgi:hypothetical protein
MRSNRTSGSGRSPARSSTSRTASVPAPTAEPGRPNGPIDAPPDTISQAVLEAYRQSKDRLDQMKERFETQRRDLIQLLLDGTPVEPGRLRAVVRSSAQRRLSAPKLAEVLGEDEVEELRNLVAPTIQTQLLVTEDS